MLAYIFTYISLIPSMYQCIDSREGMGSGERTVRAQWRVVTVGGEDLAT